MNMRLMIALMTGLVLLAGVSWFALNRTGAADLSPEELEAGYASCYERLFSHRSIWSRRPQQLSAVPAYLVMTYLYKRSNRLWAFLIRHRLVSALWRPLVKLSRRRHLRWRARLARSGELVTTRGEAHDGPARQVA